MQGAREGQGYIAGATKYSHHTPPTQGLGLLPEMSWGKANMGACPNPVRLLVCRHHGHMQMPCTCPSPISPVISHLKPLRACLSGQCLPSTAHGRDFCLPPPRAEMTLYLGRAAQGGCALVCNTLGLHPVLDTQSIKPHFCPRSITGNDRCTREIPVSLWEADEEVGLLKE